MATAVGERASARRDRALRRAATLHAEAVTAGQGFQFGKAETLLHRALRLLDSIDDLPPPEPAVTVQRVRVVVSLGYAEAELGSWRAGLDRLGLAEELARGLPDPLQDELLALVTRQRGLILLLAGQTLHGLQMLDATVSSLELALAAGKIEPTVLASACLNVGFAHLNLARPTEAAGYFRRSLAVSVEHGIDLMAAKARHNLGYAAQLTGDMTIALAHFREAEETYRRLATGLLPTLWLDQARAQLAAGLPDGAAEHLDLALPELRRQGAGQEIAETELTRAAAAFLAGEVRSARRLARAAKRRFERRGNTRWAAIAELAALRAEAATALASGRVPAALPVQAVKLAEALRALLLEDETALALLLAARLELRRGQLAAATNLLDQVRSPRATAPVDHRMLLRLCRAELAIAGGNRRRALAEARAGLGELGKARDRMGGLEMVCGTAIHGLQLGELAIRLVLGGRTDARRLFGWLERTRAQVYRYEPVPRTVDERTAEQIAEIRQLRRAVQLERLAGRPARKQSAQVAALERDVIRQGWYASSWGKPRPVVKLGEVADALGDRALISFAVSGDDLVAVAVAGRRTRLVRLGSAAAAIEAARRLHADLDALAPDGLPAPIAEVVAGSAVRGAAAIDRQFAPLWTIVGGRELVVVPTGPLYAVPWGVLESLRGTPVVVAPSATAWLTAAQAAEPDGPTLLATGPDLSPQIAEGNQLDGVYPEAVRLAGSDATSADVLAGLDGARIAHLAAHGEHEPANALFSRLQLADGPMFAHELSQLRRPPGQVVLAACELALNHVRPGDEALGFAGALLAGGVRTVVAAVSRVGDAAAAAAMVRYHELVAAGTSPASALADTIAVDPLRRPFICMGAS